MLPAPLVARWTLTLRDYADHTLNVAGDRIVWREGGHRLLCVLPSGRLAWQRELRGGDDGHGELCQMSGSVYIDAQPVLRIDVRTGYVLATRDLGPWPTLRSSSGLLTCSSDAERVYRVLDPASLASVWDLVDPKEGLSLHDGLICAPEQDGGLRLIDPATGDLIARVPPPFGVAGHLHFRDSVCLFGDRTRVAFDFANGQLGWRRDEAPPSRELAIEPGSSLTVASIGYQDWPRAHDGVAICQGRALSAYDMSTGERLWRQFDGLGVNRCSDPCEGRMAVATTDGRVHLVDAASGGVIATSEPLNRRISVVQVAPGGGVVAESFAYDRNSSQIHFLELPPAAADAPP